MTQFTVSSSVLTLSNFQAGLLDWLREQLHDPSSGDALARAQTQRRASAVARLGWAACIILLGLAALGLLVGAGAPVLVRGLSQLSPGVLQALGQGVVTAVAPLLVLGVPALVLLRGYRGVLALCVRGHELRHGLRLPVPKGRWL